jgi:hypothetical protein
MLKRPPAIYVLCIFGLWWAFVVLSGAGLSIGGPWDFTATGQLGDSFGILSALMASMAAIFTYQTLVDTRRQASDAEREAERQRQETIKAQALAIAEREKSDLRDGQRDKADARRDSERTYFGLLDLRFRVLSDLRVGPANQQQIGTDAAAVLIASVHASFYEAGSKMNYAKRYLHMYANNRNDLGHYFRFTYHIVKFANDNFGSDAYKYVRLLRAQLSHAELVLIALNCAHGEGVDKFARWVERYSLLHNIDPSDRKTFELDQYFAPKAFDPKGSLKRPAQT